jgi:hypothetical protein
MGLTPQDRHLVAQHDDLDGDVGVTAADESDQLEDAAERLVDTRSTSVTKPPRTASDHKRPQATTSDHKRPQWSFRRPSSVVLPPKGVFGVGALTRQMRCGGQLLRAGRLNPDPFTVDDDLDVGDRAA